MIETVQKIEDKRLERLFDYTKFHIGIYLSAGSGLVALLGLSSKGNAGGLALAQLLAQLVGSPRALTISLLFMVIAGMAGGVIASSCTECVSYEDLWERRQGPFGSREHSG
jgi:hypothetical protein